MGDQRDLPEVEPVDDRRQVVGQAVVVVAASRVARPAMAAPVVGDAAQALVGQLDELVLPDIGIEAPGMGEDHGLAAPPVDMEQARAVFGLDERRPRHAWSLGLGRPAACGDKGGDGSGGDRGRSTSPVHRDLPQARAGAASTKPTTDLMRPSPPTTTKSVPLM